MSSSSSLPQFRLASTLRILYVVKCLPSARAFTPSACLRLCCNREMHQCHQYSGIVYRHEPGSTNRCRLSTDGADSNGVDLLEEMLYSLFSAGPSPMTRCIRDYCKRRAKTSSDESPTAIYRRPVDDATAISPRRNLREWRGYCHTSSAAPRRRV